MFTLSLLTLALYFSNISLVLCIRLSLFHHDAAPGVLHLGGGAGAGVLLWESGRMRQRR